MEKALNQIFAELQSLKDSQTRMEFRINKLESLLIAKHPHPVKQPEKPRYQPYFDIEAMMTFCNSTGKHPGDLTSEEMSRFRLRERTITSSKRSK